ncbi:unnamed protein product [Kuraishia capsulata CBS 1993]|uniref:Uncharacterized protein n=1 Tax=Kuraishia capsulata CBS 1993 TaxID=1382522 RepID=W6MXP3_9ASCO|nr:uncharacterized protein KUCA_T00005228001 [Kuraishia capsulata CBS 1993]CDK29240.1 unnamed protein product [Kuraishia capsulata CBS 1993]
MEPTQAEQELVIGDTASAIGGNDIRQWLNREITPYLLKGMKQLVKEKEVVAGDELKWLGEYLVAENEKKKQAKS